MDMRAGHLSAQALPEPDQSPARRRAAARRQGGGPAAISVEFSLSRSRCCNKHVTIYAILSDFIDHMTTQSMGLIVLLSEHF